VSTHDVHTNDAPTSLATPRTLRMVRRFDAPRSRVYRCWTVPEELIRWFPQRIEGSLAAGTRSVLIFPDQRVWWDVSVLESDRRFEFHWPWLPGETWETTVSVLLEPAGYGTLLTLTDGPWLQPSDTKHRGIPGPRRMTRPVPSARWFVGCAGDQHGNFGLAGSTRPITFCKESQLDKVCQTGRC
jgi:uncharacterized protein YndB with AHSA1/START domain